MVPHLLNNFGSLSPLHFTRMSSKAFLLLPPAAHCLWISGLTSSFPEPGLGLHIPSKRSSQSAHGLVIGKRRGLPSKRKDGSPYLKFFHRRFYVAWVETTSNPHCTPQKPHMSSHVRTWHSEKLQREKNTERERRKSFVKTYRLSKCAWNIMTFKIYHSDIYSHNSKRLERLLVRFSRYCEMIRITLRPHMYTRLADTSLLCPTSIMSRLAFLSTAGGIEHIL